MAARKPAIKQGTNRGRRVYWLACPKCGDGPERGTKVAARNDLNNHKCDG